MNEPTKMAEGFEEILEQWQERGANYPAPEPPTKEHLAAMDQQMQEARARAEMEYRQERVQRTVPRRYVEAKTDRSEVNDWLGKVLEGEGTGLLLVGPTGTGKTHDIWAAVRSLILAGFTGSIRYKVTPLLLSELQPPANAYETITELGSAHLLVLDDLGANKHSEWVETVLFQILDVRYQHMRPTIVASNVPPKDLGSHVGDRLADRIKQMCSQVTYTGPSKRGRAS